MQEEIWKEVPETKGLYFVSNLGRVKSLWYNKERILKQTKCSDGYYGVHLYYNKKRVSIRTHKLLAIVFLNHKPNGYSLVVDHIDGDYLNNNIENLQLITQRENTSKKNVSKTSKYIGVCYYKQTGKWKSAITVNGVVKHLGYFIDEHQAHLAYQEALSKLNN